MTDKKKIVILTHGGAGSDPAHADGTAIAGQIGMMGLQTGEPILDAACNAVTILEDDSRFNAGVGSHRRDDGSIGHCLKPRIFKKFCLNFQSMNIYFLYE